MMKITRKITLITAFAAAAALAATAQADVITVPGDGYEGPYRLLFITTATTDATSTDIDDYNTIVQTAGDAVLSGFIWKVLGGTATVGARDNTGALATGDTDYSAAIDVPIYTTDGDRVANNNAAIWAGSFMNRIMTQTGVEGGFNMTVHVGFLAGGDIRASGTNHGPLGNLSGTVAGAISSRTGQTNMYGNHNIAATTATPLFALSGVIGGDPAPRAAPEITSFTSLGSGNFELTLKGEVSTGYEFRSSPILDFTPGDLVGPLTAVDPLVGTIDGTNNSVLITDENGDGTVQMALSGPSNFVRARIPPLLEENFDAAGPGLPAGWVTVNDPVTATTVWDVGDPSGLPDLQNGNGTNCVGTNVVIGDFAHEDATVTLTSPPVSIPAEGATLSFRQYIDSDIPDVGAVRLLDATTDTEISGGAFPDTDIVGIEEGWANESYQLPLLARGKTVRVVFEFKTNAVDNFDTKGFYIDDVFVTGN